MYIYSSVLESLINEARGVDRKCFGYLYGKDGIICDYYIFKKDLRREKGKKEYFEKIGNYYRDNNDAGFLADPYEMIKVEHAFSTIGLSKIGVFHVHQRHPDVFTYADWELHPTSKLIHLVISLRNRYFPKIAWFKVNKETKNPVEMFKSIPVFITHKHFIPSYIDRLTVEYQSDYDKYYLYQKLIGLSQIAHKKLWNQYRLKEKQAFLKESQFINGIKDNLVTNHEYNLFIPNSRKDNNYPVTNVNYYDAYLFADWAGCKLTSTEKWERYAVTYVNYNNIFKHDNLKLEKGRHIIVRILKGIYMKLEY